MNPEQMKLGDLSLQVEEASPISSRPPAMTVTSSAGTGLFEDELLAGELGGGAGGGSGGGNRWPRQETIALLKIRSEMDTAFKDANPKGPLWEEVSRKLGEFGYKRNAKKCKEKFENVHKYYKRTKEGRAGRQDGKSYKFFTELEALTAATSSPSSMIPAPAAPAGPSGIGFSNPTPVSSSIRFQPPPVMFSVTHHPPPSNQQLTVATGAAPSNIGISFSSDTESFASDSSDDDMGIEEHEVGNRVGSEDRKRKRTSSSPTRTDGCNETMMEFFERLMKQVLQKQEAMQQKFLEAIENREQDRMIREEAWKRQEIARYNREHELMAQERAIAASRDSAIIAFLQKISGQTVQLPPAIPVPLVVPTAPPTPTTPQPPVVSMPPPSSTPIQIHQSSQLHQQHQQLAFLEPAPKSTKYQQQQQLRHKNQQTPLSVDHHHHQVLTVIPEQQIPPPPPQEIGTSIGGSEPSSSRWPKEEILALIQLRSGLEYRYLEAGPKGPLWEDISAGMQRIGYKRNAKRCKEKWENINKYYKKVKESNKKRPEDAKTCPYYHQLDELYRNRILGGGGSGSGSGGFPNINLSQNKPDEQVGAISDPVLAVTLPQEKSGGNSEIKTSYGGLTATLFGEGSAASGDKKPEDSVKIQQYQNQQEQQLIMGDYGKIDGDESDDLDQEDDEEGEEDDEEDNEDEMKMGYKIEFQGQNTANSSNGGGNGGPSFLTMVQ
ncbi:trihelix transcription factor GTL1-like [Impatiens glandulifera]|uniref:trihelix transcription factor GTL1-like n=1 Tax=Impatiens glandulifera TaxID=253017 RepID=UPI001FB18A80|nr:trihelix transcription factor GTL1-like [Impatiens glandulifera]